MKDLIEEIDTRIKSPLFGYYLFSSVAINWAEIFYLIFDDGTVSNRIEYFKSGTSVYSLFLIPILLALSFSLIYPWIRFVVTFFSKWPNSFINKIQAQSQSKFLEEQQLLEKARNKLLREKELEVIDRAMRDKEIDEIEDAEVREEVQSKVGDLRATVDNVSVATSFGEAKSLNDDQIDLLKFICSKGGEVEEVDAIKNVKFDKVKAEFLLEDMQNKGYVIQYWSDAYGAKVYRLETPGKKLMVDLGFAK